MHQWTGGTSELADRGCYVCGGSDNLLSTDVIIEEEGILALCAGCTVTLAKFGGYRLWSPELEAELENWKVRARDAERYQKLAEDALIDVSSVALSVESRRAQAKAELEAKLSDRNSAGQFVKKVVLEGTSNA